MSPRKHHVIATVLRRVGRALMLLVLVVGAVAVSLGLASTGGERPTTTGVDDPAAAAATKVDTSAADQERALATAAITARRVSDEDSRILDLVRQVPYRGAAYVVRTSRASTKAAKPADTLVLTARPTPYDRAELIALGALVRRGDTDYLQSSVLVAPGAKLFLTGGDPIRMRSDTTGFTSIVAWKGELRLLGTSDRPLEITSWNANRRHPDFVEADGRSFIRTVGSRTVVRDARITRLGFWSGRTGGLSVEGGGDIAASSASAAVTVSPFAGRDQVTVDNLMTGHLHYGLYVHDIRSGTVRRAQFTDSSVQGMLMHGNTRGLSVEDTSATGSGSNGFTIARGSHDIVLRGILSEENGADGLRVDGRPMAVGPTAGGADPARHGDVRILGSTLSGNVGSGAAVVGAVRVSITGSTLRGNADGITVRDRASDVRLSDNRVLDSAGFGIGVTDGPVAVDVSDNDIDAAATGVAVRGAVATVQGNTVSGATQHAVALVGRATGSRIEDNTLSGQGPSALAVARLKAPTTVLVAANDDKGWRVDKDLTWAQQLENHPLLLLWLPILLLPLTAGVITVRRRRTRSERSRGHARARLSVPPTPGSAGMPGPRHPSALESDPDSRTRVTVMA